MNPSDIDISTLTRTKVDPKTYGSCEGCVFLEKENNGCMKSFAKDFKKLEPCIIGEYPDRTFYIFKETNVQ
jgi:hypothetical protein